MSELESQKAENTGRTVWLVIRLIAAAGLVIWALNGAHMLQTLVLLGAALAVAIGPLWLLRNDEATSSDMQKPDEQNDFQKEYEQTQRDMITHPAYSVLSGNIHNKTRQ